jgi:hypothetical protein
MKSETEDTIIHEVSLGVRILLASAIRYSDTWHINCVQVHTCTDVMDPASNVSGKSREERKKAGRELKRQRIEAAGGVRPRGSAASHDDDPREHGEPRRTTTEDSRSSTTKTKQRMFGPERHTQIGPKSSSSLRSIQKHDGGGGVSERHLQTNCGSARSAKPISGGSNGTKSRASRPPSQGVNHRNNHRFGRVMDQPPCPNQPRTSTISIAIPGSVVANCQTRELKTILVGQVARAATIYRSEYILIKPCTKILLMSYCWGLMA